MIHWSIRTETPSWILSTIKDDWSLSVLRNAFTRVLQILLVLTASRAFYLRSSSQFFLPPHLPTNYPHMSYTSYPSLQFSSSTSSSLVNAAVPASKQPKHPLDAPGTWYYLWMVQVEKNGGRLEHRGQQANLIVDPTAFRHSENEDGLEEVRRRLSIRRSRIIRRGLAYSMVLLTMACCSFLVEDDEGGKVDVAGFKIWGATFVFGVNWEKISE